MHTPQSPHVKFAVSLALIGALGPSAIDMYLASMPAIAAEYGTTWELAAMALAGSGRKRCTSASGASDASSTSSARAGTSASGFQSKSRAAMAVLATIMRLSKWPG